MITSHWRTQGVLGADAAIGDSAESRAAFGRLVAIGSSRYRAFLAFLLTSLLIASCGERGPSVAIESFSPSGEVPQASNFTLTFSADVVPDSLVGIEYRDLPFAFEPDLPGVFVWISPEKLRFYPEALLLPSTEYKAEVSSDLTTPYGLRIDGNTEFAFRTHRFSVTNASVLFEYIPETNKEINLVAVVEFNYPVDPADVAQAVRLSYADGSSVPIFPTEDSIATVISLRAERLPRTEREEQLLLTVAKGLRCRDCGLGLEREFSRPVSVPGQTDLKVEGVTPIRESPDRGYIRIEFNLPLQSDDAAQYITLEPALAFRISSSYRYLDLLGDFDVGTTYQLGVARGLKAIDGSPLKRDFSTAVTFRKVDIPPQISFAGEGFYLTRSGNLNLGLSSINVDSVTIGLEKVYANNLTHLLNSADLASQYSYVQMAALGKHLADTTLLIDRIDNEEVTTPFSVADLLRSYGDGIYHLSARSRETGWRRAETWVLATDMGIVAKQSKEKLWVWVNSLSSLEPVRDVVLQIYSRNNQLLLSGVTNEEGIAVFDDFADRTDGFVPYVITASGEDDFSFLELTRRRISVADFDVGGRPPLTVGYDAFVYSDRGIYRPGETAHLAAIVRDADLAAPEPFPLQLTVTGPDNRILSRQKVTLSTDGFAEFALSIPDYVKTGKYNAVLTIGPKDEIGRTAFNVEEFVPDRMKVKLTTARQDYSAGETIDFTVEGMTLFGPPASGRRVDAAVELEAFPFSPEQWRSFTFGDQRKSFTQEEHKLDQRTLDENGKTLYSFAIPDNLDPPAGLRGVITATVLEPGGRGVTAYHGVSIHPHVTYVGLRRPQEGYAIPDQETQIECLVVNPEGEAVAGRRIEVSFYRIIWQSVLRQVQREQNYRYVSERVEQLQGSFIITSAADVVRFGVTPRAYGRYLVVARDTGSGATTSMPFYASGWGYSPWAMDNPDRVKLDLDKEEYLPGEQAQLQVRTPFSGKLLITVENDEVLDYQLVSLEDNTATIEIPVKQSYKPNVYISAHLIRSTHSLDRDTPVRAFGVRPLMVNTDDQRLEVELQAPEVMLPDRELTVDFSVQGATGRRTPITIAAVDVGILQLTDFRTPDPHGHFLGRRHLEIETRDPYSVILPEISSTSTGGGIEAARKRHLTPISIRRVKPLALWSGLLYTDDRGYGTVTFDIPEFSGTVRLMAVAASAASFGSSEREVIVRRPLQLTPTFPRFLAGGDRFQVPVSVFNGTGQRATFTISMQVDGPATVTGTESQEIELRNQEEQAVYFDLRAAAGMGKIRFKLKASGAGEEAVLETEVPLRPPVPVITLSGSGVVDKNDPATFEFPADWIEGSADFKITVSSFPVVRFSRSLQYLLRYPHGCLEQTVSRVFPLLYLDDLARMTEPELFERNSADYYIEEGISKLERMQSGVGEFDFWPRGGYVHDWSSVYAAHFLIEARREGYLVADRVYDAAISAIGRQAKRYDYENRWTNQTAAYACYVLALAGQPDRSSMNFLKDKLGNGSRDYSQYQLAGAFALSGDMATARQLLPKAAAPVADESERESGGNFNSSARAKAIMLDVLAQVDPKNPMVPLLVEDLSGAALEFGRWYTTQENAFALLALGKIMRREAGGTFAGAISVGGDEVAKFDTRGATVSGKDWAGARVDIQISGNATCYYYWRADGLPIGQHIDEYDTDLSVRRRYLDEEGNPVGHGSITQGDLLVAEITVKAPTESLKNVAVVDLLPAGLEIENPRLQSRRSLPWIAKETHSPLYMDFRDDRMIFYTDLRQGKDYTFYYSLRAVTLGDFFLPPIRGEAMYAPAKASVGSSGRLEVVR